MLRIVAPHATLSDAGTARTFPAAGTLASSLATATQPRATSAFVSAAPIASIVVASRSAAPAAVALRRLHG